MSTQEATPTTPPEEDPGDSLPPAQEFSNSAGQIDCKIFRGVTAESLETVPTSRGGSHNDDAAVDNTPKRDLAAAFSPAPPILRPEQFEQLNPALQQALRRYVNPAWIGLRGEPSTDDQHGREGDSERRNDSHTASE